MRALSTLAAASGGMSAGAMLLIRMVLLPFWRGLPPAEFRRWFASHSGRIRGLMVPLGATAAVSAIATVATEAATEHTPPTTSAIAAAAAAGVVAVTVTVNESANEKFAQSDFDDEETTLLLGRWARWHDLRVALGLLGAIAAVRTAANR
jgi:Anthrone oxygenase